MLEIYTDGACSQNGTWTGGWGVVVVENDKRIAEADGGGYKTTNNRMELSAFIAGLKYIKENKVTAKIYTDSSYIYNAIDKGYLSNWVRNGWKTAKKEPVANQDLWLELLTYELPQIEKIKGHSNNKWNCYADSLAVSYRMKLDAEVK